MLMFHAFNETSISIKWTQQVVFIHAYVYIHVYIWVYIHVCTYVTTTIEVMNLRGSRIHIGGVERNYINTVTHV